MKNIHARLCQLYKGSRQGRTHLTATRDSEEGA